MKKTLAILTAVLGLGTIAASGQEDEEQFRKNEWEVSPFVTYVDKPGDKWGLGTALTYYLTKNFGFGAATYWTDFSGTFFDNFEGEAYFRITQFKRLNPYAVGSVGYQFDNQYWFETLGAGANLQVLKRMVVFGDISYRFVNENRGGAFLRLGVRFSF